MTSLPADHRQKDGVDLVRQIQCDGDGLLFTVNSRLTAYDLQSSLVRARL